MEAKHQIGHRKRLKERFLKGGAEAMADYEVLELILFLAQPRGDMKPIAKDLITKYKNLAGVLLAHPDELKKHDKIGDTSLTAFKIIQEAAKIFAREQVLDKPILASWNLLLDYCRVNLAHETVESFHVLFMDSKNRLIADEKHQKGTVDQAFIYPREIVKRALHHDASSLILVHNHPSGDPSPSKADIELTREIVNILKPLNINVHDHVIIGKTGHRSFKSVGLI